MTCIYQYVEGDPAIRVCITHDTDYGLYGEDYCPLDSGDAIYSPELFIPED